jgi:hypothetical protein
MLDELDFDAKSEMALRSTSISFASRIVRA